MRQLRQLGLQPTSSSRTAFDYKPVSTRASTHARWFVSGLLLPLIGGLVAYGVATRDTNLISSRQAINLQDLPPIEIGDVDIPAVAPPPSLLGDTVEFVVRRNDTMDRIFRQLKLNLTDLASIRGVPGMQGRLDQLQ